MGNQSRGGRAPEHTGRGRSTRASALIVTMGVLTILAVLAFVFASVSKGERKISRTYVDQVRAKIYAMSGIETAVSKIQQFVSTPSGGAFANYSIAEGTNVPWIYSGSRNLGPLTPVESAPLCSFQTDYLPLKGDYYNADALGPGGNIVNPNNTIIGVTSYFPGTYYGGTFSVTVPGASPTYPTTFPEGSGSGGTPFQPSRFRTGDVVSVRVVDTAGQFYVNGPDPAGVSVPPGAPGPSNLSQSWIDMLNRLGLVLQSNPPSPPAGLGLSTIPPVRCPHGYSLSTSGADIGNRVKAIRNNLGRNILMKSEMQRSGMPTVYYDTTPTNAPSGYHDFEIVSQFLTAHAWVDRTTLDPSKLQHMRPNDPTLYYSPSGTGLASRPDYGPPGPATNDVDGLVRAALATLEPPADPLLPVASDLATATLAAVGASPSASCACDRLVNQQPSQSVFHQGNDHFGPPQQCQESVLSGAGSWPLTNDVLQPRAPMNINTAPYHSLRATMEGLSGVFWDRQPYSSWTVGGAGSRANYEGNGYTNAQRQVITPAIAHFVACHILSKRARNNGSPYDTPTPAMVDPNGSAALSHPMNYLLPGEPGYNITPWPQTVVPANEFPGGPFRTYTEWYKFLDFLATQPGSPFDPNPNRRLAQINILKANANPNSHINKFNFDEYMGARFGDVDKADLDTWSTEFSFRAHGYYEVDSVGRVLENKGTANSPALVVVAEQKVSTLIHVYDLVKHSTQRQFLDRRLSTLNVQTYPEQVNPSNNTAGDPQLWLTQYGAEWDGYLGVATTDYGGGPPLPPSNYLYAHYTSSFGPNVFGTAEEGRSLIDGTGLPNASTLGPQSELFPDGLFAHETRRYPGQQLAANRVYGWGGGSTSEPMDEYVRYMSSGVSLGGGGTIEMWVKPTWTAKDFASGDYGHNCPTDPSFNVGTSGHNHPMGESTRAFATYGDNKKHSQGHVLGGKRLALAAQRIGYSPKSNLGGFAVPGGPDGNPGVFFITARKGDATQQWNMGNVPPFGSYYWNDVVPQWGKLFMNVYAPPVQTTNSTDPRSWGFAGRWHHVALSWSGADSWLHVDGQYNPSGRVVAWGTDSSQGNYALFIGNNRFLTKEGNGHPCNADCTIDGVKVWGSAIYSQSTLNPTPPRYKTDAMSPDPPSYRGRMMTASEAQAFGKGRIVNIAWNGWFPNYSTQSQSVTFSVTNGQVTRLLPAATTASAGKGYPLDDPNLPPLSFQGNAGENLDYSVSFSLNGSYVVGTPFIDDVSFTFIPNKIKFIYYFFQ
ncbi:MAG: hypothetical protein HYY93_01650 [Planctomycetes bacterium]|nr:hypothetical protein [Planctomycetota bacterium]